MINFGIEQKNYFKFMTIGIDVGGTNIKGVLLNNNKTFKKVRFKINSKSNKNLIIAQIFEVIETLKKRQKKINKIGIGVAGPVDFKNQKVLNPPNIPGLKNIYLGKIIKKKFGVKTVIDNDVHCLVLAETILGAAKGKKSVVGLALGTGVGGGIILNGKIIHGAKGTAGELGHMTIKKGGWKCKCGSRGCLEAYICERGQEKTAKEILGKSMSSIALQKSAEKGNKKALKAWDIIGENLGIGLANIVDTLNPEIIIIGGGLAWAGDLLLRPAKETMGENALSPLAKKTKVVRAKLGKFAGAIGAALL